MNKLFTVTAAVFAAVVMWAQQPMITFEKTNHDFGEINEADGRVTTVFKFKNEGAEPLVLSNVKASCGCTTPNWTKQPIEPGETGEVTATYNPNGRPGNFNKTITVTCNASNSPVRLTIKGKVIPKQAKPVDNYPIKMGKLSLKSKNIEMGDVKKGDAAQQMIEYANQTKDTVQISLLIPNADYWEIAPTLETLMPGQTGKIVVNFLSQKCPLYGPIQEKLFVVVDNKVVQSDDYRMLIRTHVHEDFSAMSEQDKMQAPIIETEKVVEMGSIQAGKKLHGAIKVKNVGHNALIVRRAYCDDEAIKATGIKSLRSGKKSDIKVEINTLGMENGKYERKLLVISNDPNNAEIPVVIRWSVE